MNNFAKMIERMEDLVLSGVGVPFTPFTMVNSERLVPLLDRIRESLPDEIKHSQKILDQREEILTEAQQRANQVLLDSKAQAEHLLSESELLKAVHTEAERIRQQILGEIDVIRKKAFEEAETMKAKAYEEARAVREGADHYADSILMSLDKSLSEFHTVVRNGQRHLKKAKLDAQASNLKSGYATMPPSPQAITGQAAQPTYGITASYGQPGQPSTATTTPPSSYYMSAGSAPTGGIYPESLPGSLTVSPPSHMTQQRSKVEDFLKQTTI